MKPLLAIPGLWLALSLAQAAQWDFAPAIGVSGAPKAGVYPHLDGAGRKHIAVSRSSVAVVWEDDRDGSPQIYISIKPAQATGFAAARRVSDGAEAYEPAIVSLADDSYAVAWEQDGSVFGRLVNTRGPGPKLQLSGHRAGQVSLAGYAGRIFAGWREQYDDGWQVRVAAIGSLDADRLTIEASHAVETQPIPAEVQFPSLAVNQAGICIAWEDRREGHTRLLTSFAERLDAGFDPPRELNEYFSGRNQYDKGSGATRVALASFGDDEVLAAWMDKRRSGGYGIFAALGSGNLFGPNEKVHGAEGDRLPHYNPAVAGNPSGSYAVAWDDYRRGDSDIWIAVYGEDEWGADFSPPPASGPGVQQGASIALDADGGLHLLWIERATADAPGELRYSRGLPR